MSKTLTLYKGETWFGLIRERGDIQKIFKKNFQKKNFQKKFSKKNKKNFQKNFQKKFQNKFQKNFHTILLWNVGLFF